MSAPSPAAPFTLADLTRDPALRAREFPVVEHACYLAHAAVCPLPARVAQAMTAYLARASSGGQFEHLHASAEAALRAHAAELIGAEPAEIALVPSTSAGLSLVAAGLPWQAGESVVISQGDFPSNVYPWLRLRDRGVEVRSIPPNPERGLTWDDVRAQLDGSTRLVAVSSVHYATGAVADLERIGRELAARNVLLCVDAIQSLGALPTSARNADFLVADAHKWLLGPQGMGILFVRRSRLDTLEPALLGWKSVRAERDFVEQRLEYADTARRYEPGSLNALGVVGLAAALQLLTGLGIPSIAARIAQLRAALAPELVRRGYQLLGGDAASGSGILSFLRPGDDMQRQYRALDADRIIVSLRQDPLGRACIRVAPHFYNSEAELARVLDKL
jgi:selenocysteine lyase/cysteine desulfurase